MISISEARSALAKINPELSHTIGALQVLFGVTGRVAVEVKKKTGTRWQPQLDIRNADPRLHRSDLRSRTWRTEKALGCPGAAASRLRPWCAGKSHAAVTTGSDANSCPEKRRWTNLGPK